MKQKAELQETLERVIKFLKPCFILYANYELYQYLLPDFSNTAVHFCFGARPLQRLHHSDVRWHSYRQSNRTAQIAAYAQARWRAFRARSRMRPDRMSLINVLA